MQETGDSALIPGLGRSPRGGNGYPLQCSCLENPMDRGAWRTTVHGVRKNWTRLKRLSTHSHQWVNFGFIANISLSCFSQDLQLSEQTCLSLYRNWPQDLERWFLSQTVSAGEPFHYVPGSFWTCSVINSFNRRLSREGPLADIIMN